MHLEWSMPGHADLAGCQRGWTQSLQVIAEALSHSTARHVHCCKCSPYMKWQGAGSSMPGRLHNGHAFAVLRLLPSAAY